MFHRHARNMSAAAARSLAPPVPARRWRRPGSHRHRCAAGSGVAGSRCPDHICRAVSRGSPHPDLTCSVKAPTLTSSLHATPGLRSVPEADAGDNGLAAAGILARGVQVLGGQDGGEGPVGGERTFEAARLLLARTALWSGQRAVCHGARGKADGIWARSGNPCRSGNQRRLPCPRPCRVARGD